MATPLILDKYFDILPYLDIEETVKQFGPVNKSTSKVVAKCTCGKLIRTNVKSLRRTLKRQSSYACISCRTQSLWEDDGFRKNQSDAIKRKWSDRDYREKKSEITKRQWCDPGYRSKHEETLNNPEHLAKVKAVTSNPAYREARSRDASSFWSDENKVEAFLKRRKNPEWKKRHSASVKQTWCNPEYRDQKIAAAKELWQSEEYKGKHKIIWDDPCRISIWSQRSKELWRNEQYRDKQAKSRAAFIRSGKMSSIEMITANILAVMGLEYRSQEVVGPYAFDFYVLGHDLYVECQGEYWHSLPNAKKNDAAKFSYLEKARPASRILYLNERDFFNPGLVRQKISDVIYGTRDSCVPVHFSLSDVIITALPNRLDGQRKFLPQEEFLRSFHYAQYGRRSKVCFGAFLDDRLVAVCKFSGVVRKEVATSIGVKTSETLELDRFCIHPLFHKRNFASWFISRCVKRLFDALPTITTLVSFADSTYGHTGTIYKASNWNMVGKVKPDYYYVTPDGWVMHKKTLYDHARSLRKKETEYAVEYGYSKIYGKEKIKFSFKR